MRTISLPQAFSCQTVVEAVVFSFAVSSGYLVAAIFGCVWSWLVCDSICVAGFLVIGSYYFIIGALDVFRVQLRNSRRLPQN